MYFCSRKKFNCNNTRKYGVHYIIRAIAGGTLNYYSAEHEQMDIKVDGNHATLTGRSRVNAAVFGGGRHTWRLQLYFQLSRYNGHWLFTNAQASTY